MIGNISPALRNHVSNIMKQVDAYGYGKNPWTLHVNIALLNLAELMWWYGACAIGVIWDP